ncbi:DNA recombination protein RmuC [uncultured Traorella sp.]|uniref:DNA recombination protein RmuC n=1 Tax=uncultured Traorella sp. TaxID=1929048 RepID=UPI0025E8FDF0|nr:DNA recombination protein RmuC [uncultured Traorella sp.]
MEFIVLYILCAVIIVLLFVLLLKPNKNKDEMRNLHSKIQTLNETQKVSNELMSERLREMNETIKGMNEMSFQTNESIRKQLSETTSKLEEKVNGLTLQNESKLEAMRLTVESKITSLQEDNAKKLEAMRLTVDEKLQETLDKRISQSFQLVNDRLEQVYKGLGEMQTLANGVGDLKKVLSNVKTRGILGEIQLKAILEEILSPEQYEENVATKKGSSNVVEFAIKLPGDGSGSIVYLPIDSKFPGDKYAQLVDAYDEGDPAKIALAQKELDAVIKKSAKDIHDKYIDVPNTTEFAIMFLPFEGLYAEVVRRGFVESLQRDYKINIAGPTTMAALLNSLQMGFRTLAIQKRSSEVWEVLGAVKSEFEKFGTVLENTQNKLNMAQKELDNLVGVRTRQIQKKLDKVSSIDALQSEKILEINQSKESTSE